MANFIPANGYVRKCGGRVGERAKKRGMCLPITRFGGEGGGGLGGGSIDTLWAGG
jgi:hypothetical protein